MKSKYKKKRNYLKRYNISNYQKNMKISWNKNARYKTKV